MAFTITWWYWLVLAMLLIAAEMVVPSFTLFWFGLSAALVSLILYLVPSMSPSIQIICWALGSIGFTALWFIYFKPTMIDRTKAGISKEAVIGETGIVIKIPQDSVRGMVRFALPLLGADEWEFICSEECHIGDRVEVVDISGNTLVVRLKGN